MRAATKTVTSVQLPRMFGGPSQTPKPAALGHRLRRAVRRDGKSWIVTTGAGDLSLRRVSDEALGVVDFHWSPPTGIEALAASRVIPNGDGVEYVFTQFQTPDMPDDVFLQSVRALTHELTVLQALLEVDCPL